MEISCIETEKHIVVAVYRPPYSANFTVFESVMENVLKVISKSNKSIIVCGDFNVDLYEVDSITTRFLSLFTSFNLVNIFMEPTRITETTASCLDNIFCNCDFQDNSILNCFKSDHSGQLVSFPVLKNVQKIKFSTRPITDNRIEKYRNSLISNLPCPNFDTDNPDDFYRDFFTIIHKEFENNFPQKVVTNSQSFKFSDWATVGIRKSRNTLYSLYEEKTYTHADSFKSYVKNYSKIFRRVCYTAKQMHISSKIKTADNKIKAVWQVINSETKASKPRELEYNIESGTGLVKQDKDVAEVFDKFFTNIPVKTTESLRSSPVQADILLKSNVTACTELFDFKRVDPSIIVKVFF
ncbi:uncharacterized protein LOC126368285 [Pectinophora gossypiella]|uniref:uncharacterized protein LOC126368285 n=1 Tax=Pectinophora gossypiella TaxID=13191 RepID=UPI00214E7F31|nr:uncharacterized protein LOC126368285 [Pectinophora gossypiella]